MAIGSSTDSQRLITVSRCDGRGVRGPPRGTAAAVTAASAWVHHARQGTLAVRVRVWSGSEGRLFVVGDVPPRGGLSR
ncbi:hypothetical protein FMEAI12_4190039 [Parafrankia sp. Ea1.12]|nr:hypothetical protein FMEAI12_4190039 [Parafrankia sp. Ea1.12]